MNTARMYYLLLEKSCILPEYSKNVLLITCYSLLEENYWRKITGGKVLNPYNNTP